jgi:hypothetical protein
LEKALPLPDGLPAAPATAADGISDAYRMLTAPYTALWSAYAAGFQAWARILTEASQTAPAPAARPRPAPRKKRPPRKV